MENLKTTAIVLRRTNFGEADRILALLTPEGKLSVMAKGVRKEKSKLAGGIELFSVSDVVIHRGKGDLGVLTSVRLKDFYKEIMKDLEAMEFMGGVLKDVARRTEQVDDPEFFALVEQVLAGVDESLRRKGDLDVARAWWGINVARVSGEEMNLRFDVSGEKLAAEKRYGWDALEGAFRESAGGEIGAEQIKLMRLMASSPLKLVMRVAGVNDLAGEIWQVVKRF